MNRRIHRACAQAIHLGFDPIFRAVTPEEHRLSVKYNWYLRQHDLRTNPGLHPVESLNALNRPDPLHTQWLSSTLTPHEYQHLVRRSRNFIAQTQAQPTYDPDWWLHAAESIEDDFLYRHLAPCGAD